MLWQRVSPFLYWKCCFHCIIINYLSKGQLISKSLFGVFNSSKKRTWKSHPLNTWIFALPYWGRNFSFIFWKTQYKSLRNWLTFKNQYLISLDWILLFLKKEATIYSLPFTISKIKNQNKMQYIYSDLPK